MANIGWSAADDYANFNVKFLLNALELQYRDYNLVLSSWRSKLGLPVGIIGRPQSDGDKVSYSGIFGTVMDDFNRLLYDTSGYASSVPAAKRDTENLNELKEIALEPTSRILNTVYGKGKLMLSAEETATIIETLSRTYRYESFMHGRSLMYQIAREQGVREAVNEYLIYAKELLVKWFGHFKCLRGSEARKVFSVLVYILVNSEGRQLILDAVEKQNPDIILQSNRRGIEKITFENEKSREETQKTIIDKLENDEAYRLSHTFLLRRNADPRKLESLLNALPSPQKEEAKSSKKPESERITYIS